jgi:hypothetical protein
MLACGTALAGFSGTDVFIPSVGRRPGAAGSNWFTTVWVHNPGSAAASVQFSFLERDRTNLTPLTYNDSIPAGDTRRYDDAVATMFGVEKFGALRVVSDARVVVNSRVFSQDAAAGPGESFGQSFTAVPSAFAIGLGESTQLLGAYQTSPKADSDFRYNFGFVETVGANATVRVTARDASGVELASKDYPVRTFEPRQFAIEDVLPTVNAENLKIDVAVVAGAGKVIAFGSGIANRSNDPTTFEMTYRDELLATGQELTAVAHDASLAGEGTSAAPLAVADSGVAERHLAAGSVTGSKVADAQLVRSVNALRDDVTLTAGAGVTITPTGNGLTIASSAQPCPECAAGSIFNELYYVSKAGGILFTVDPGRTRFLTGVQAQIMCETGTAEARLDVGTKPVLYLTLGNSNWMSGGGAPIVVPGGQSLMANVFTFESCTVYFALTGYQF